MQSEQPPDELFYDEEMIDSPAPSQHTPLPSTSPSPVNVNPVTDPPESAVNAESPRCSQNDQDRHDPTDDEMGDNFPASQGSVSPLSAGGSQSPISSREPGSWSLSQIQIPDSVTDAARHQICTERFFHPNGLMQPREQDLSSLDANGKAWVMERPPLSLAIDGNTWSFVDECHAGITSELLKVIYFFDIVNGMSNHFNWNGFTVESSDISGCNQNTYMKPSMAPNNKDINGVKLSQFMESDESISFRGTRRGVDTGKLLSASELSASGTVYTPLHLFRISIGFTAAVFESSKVQRRTRRSARDQDDSDEDDEMRQAIFGVVTVTTLRNVDTLKLIMVQLYYEPTIQSNSSKVRRCLTLF
jgi:hypothetical protein